MYKRIDCSEPINILLPSKTIAAMPVDPKIEITWELNLKLISFFVLSKSKIKPAATAIFNAKATPMAPKKKSSGTTVVTKTIKVVTSACR